ncbi:hypothetical protein A11A3_07413 [Alcanivorax hongdengensis A-11-3]|uniref:DUF4124 domain-containing protein n=1 Tax=Alcanivorax hongdengensis A-11-3 TaxID=1177179 RepID=L0WCA2_9GAMM|nr:hypothetical protein A11A3_07413 [Alcanivorax hongdengensis A-11-3]
MRFLIGTLLCLACASLPAQMYQWKDADGHVHFGDRAPQASSARELTVNHSGRQAPLQIRFLAREFALTPEQEQRVRDGIQRIHHFYRRQFGLDLHGTTEVNIYLMADQAHFRQWMKERVGGSSNFYAGVFIPGRNELAVWPWSDNPDDIVETLLHEANHVVLNQLSPRAPVWLHEGLSQYFQTLKVYQDRAWVTALPDAKKRIKAWIGNGKLITLRQYLSIDDRQWQRMAHQLDAIPYTVAWATTAFLMSEPSGRRTLKRMLQDLEKTDQRPTLQRLDALYPGGITQLEYHFFRWAQGDMPPQAVD